MNIDTSFFINIFSLLAATYGAYKIGFENGKNYKFAFGSNKKYGYTNYSFVSGKTLDETILKIKKLSEENNTFRLYYMFFKLIINGIKRDQANNEIKAITPIYIYNKFLVPIIDDNEKLKLNFCLDCIEKEEIPLLKDFRDEEYPFFENPINHNLLDTKICSCCKKTTDVLNPFMYTVMTELNFGAYFNSMDNKDKCPCIWH